MAESGKERKRLASSLDAADEATLGHGAGSGKDIWCLSSCAACRSKWCTTSTQQLTRQHTASSGLIITMSNDFCCIYFPSSAAVRQRTTSYLPSAAHVSTIAGCPAPLDAGEQIPTCCAHAATRTGGYADGASDIVRFRCPVGIAEVCVGQSCALGHCD